MDQSKRELDYYELSRALSRKGWKNLCVLSIAILIASGWMGWKFIQKQNNRELNAANIAWSEQRYEDSQKLLDSVYRNSETQSRYDELSLKLLLLTDPKAAVVFAEQLQKIGDSEEGFEVHIAKFALKAAIASRDKAIIESQLDYIKNSKLLRNSDPDLLTAEAWLSLYSGNLAELRKKVESALRNNPLHTGALLLRSQIQAKSKKPLEQIQAKVTLRRIGQSQEPDSILANVILLASKLAPPDSNEYQAAAERINQSPYFQFHYSLREPNILRPLIEKMETKTSTLLFRLSSQLIKAPESTRRDFLKHAFFAQERREVELARKFLNKAAKKDISDSYFSWIEARQLSVEGQNEDAVQICIQGLNTNIKANFAFLLIKILGQKETLLRPKTRLSIVTKILQSAELPISPYLDATEYAWENNIIPEKELIRYCLGKAELNPLRIAHFFSQRERPERVVQTLKRAPNSLETKMGFSLYLEALIRLERWLEARSFIDSAKILTSFDEAIANLLLTFGQGNEEESETAWNKVWVLAPQTNSPTQSFAKLGDIAFETDHTEWAALAFRSARNLGELTKLKTDSLLRYYQLERNAGRTESCLELLTIAQSQSSELDDIQRDKAYLHLLLGRSSLEAKDTLRRILKVNSSAPLARHYFGLALLKTGRAKQALDTISKYNPPHNAPPSIKVIRYAVLSANGKASEAEEVLIQIDQTHLLPEESLLLTNYLPVTIEHIRFANSNDSSSILDAAGDSEIMRNNSQ